MRFSGAAFQCAKHQSRDPIRHRIELVVGDANRTFHPRDLQRDPRPVRGAHPVEEFEDRRWLAHAA
ncbi:MAG: hypothetical protein ACK55I_07605, partial [bacterium]